MSQSKFNPNQQFSLFDPMFQMTDRQLRFLEKGWAVLSDPSQLRRNQNIDHLPYRGLLRKKQGYVLAITAINVRRVLRYALEDAEKGIEFLFQTVNPGHLCEDGVNFTNYLELSFGTVHEGRTLEI